ncbi:hypothetical protein NDU88_005113 [Pleurodeles waltl]|uniref:Uncharacterized protein n=1 Tax=Pleurodeles waltl TaxID=8319 RepID=A0AAV7MXD0_PLEWA|nr:hypothetical protein NDU88_005113 [Pleurodeles waltl]
MTASVSLPPDRPCSLGWGPSVASRPCQASRGSLPRLLGPGAVTATHGPPNPIPGRPAASRKAAVSQRGMGCKPLPALGGPPLSLAHHRPAVKDRSCRRPVASPLLVLR